MKEDSAQLVVRMPASLYLAVRDHAEKNDRSMAWVVRRAVREHLDARMTPDSVDPSRIG